jgi:ELWxxDGT repeat protein
MHHRRASLLPLVVYLAHLLGASAVHAQTIEVQGEAYFTAYSLDTGQELWKSDGTEAGTFFLTDLRPGSGSSYPRVIGRAGGLVYFTASYEPYTLQTVLLKTDGSVAGTSFVRDVSRLYGSVGLEYGGLLYPLAGR